MGVLKMESDLLTTESVNYLKILAEIMQNPPTPKPPNLDEIATRLQKERYQSEIT